MPSDSGVVQTPAPMAALPIYVHGQCDRIGVVVRIWGPSGSGLAGRSCNGIAFPNRHHCCIRWGSSLRPPLCHQPLSCSPPAPGAAWPPGRGDQGSLWMPAGPEEKERGCRAPPPSTTRPHSPVPSLAARIPPQRRGGGQPLARLLTLPEFILRLYNLSPRLLRIN